MSWWSGHLPGNPPALHTRTHTDKQPIPSKHIVCLFQGVEPVLRTYNTLIIACNMCNQPREAMAVHRRMLNEGYMPNATTYNALISAYGKAGQLDKVMEVLMTIHLDQFRRM